MLYYINGQLVGTLDSTEVAGTIGNAVVNFEANITSCPPARPLVLFFHNVSCPMFLNIFLTENLAR